jgi:thiamine-monophosphate kinase
MKTSEANLIHKLRGISTRRTLAAGVTLGIGDDAALFRPARGYETILTCDWFLEGTHFIQQLHPADAVGWKCLARAVSDVAAMGGRPRCFLLSLALPEKLTGRWLSRFLAGLRHAARELNCPLAGGDTTRQAKVLLNITVIGEVPAKRGVLRSTARPGDLIYVSGHLGEADLGLQRLRSGNRFAKNDAAVKKHLYPQPRLGLGAWLADRRIATSMMDLSDGLSTDLPRLCEASHVGAHIETARIPVAECGGEKSTPDRRLDLALNGGDDYELLFTVRPAKARRIPRAFQGVPLTAIGEITHQRKLILLGTDGRQQTLRPGGWDPFRR